MEEYLQIFTIKFGTFFAGLLGATITLMKKSQGSVLARFGGYVSAIFAIVYIVPGIIDATRHLSGWEMGSAAENILAFIFGMIANSMIESFLDDPTMAFSRWIANFKRFKKMVLGQTPIDLLPITDDNNKNLVSDKPKLENSSDNAVT